MILIGGKITLPSLLAIACTLCVLGFSVAGRPIWRNWNDAIVAAGGSIKPKPDITGVLHKVCRRPRLADLLPYMARVSSQPLRARLPETALIRAPLCFLFPLAVMAAADGTAPKDAFVKWLQVRHLVATFLLVAAWSLHFPPVGR